MEKDIFDSKNKNLSFAKFGICDKRSTLDDHRREGA